MSVAYESRFAFTYPTETTAELRRAILYLMLDGKRRSVVEIQEALGTRKEIGARIRELRNGTTSDGKWPFNDSRSCGPDEDGVFRYQVDVNQLPEEMR